MDIIIEDHYDAGEEVRAEFQALLQTESKGAGRSRTR